MIREVERQTMSGYLALAMLFVVWLGVGYWLYTAIVAQAVWSIVFATIASIVVMILTGGFFMVHPNEARVLQLFGAYSGTQRNPGLAGRTRFTPRLKCPYECETSKPRSSK